MAQVLDDKLCKELPAPAKGSKITYDEKVRGFGIRVTAAGVRSFVLNYRNRGGTERRYTIGRLGDWKTTAAREEAKRLKGEIRVNGVDPVQSLNSERDAPTMGALVERYKREHLPTKRPSSRREDEALLKIISAEIRQKKVAEIDTDEVETLHRNLTRERGPYRANRVLALLSKMFSIASRGGKNQWRADNPCKGVARNHEEARERYLNPDELGRLFKAIAGYSRRDITTATLLALLTGARTAEICGATWDQFDLTTGHWTRPSAHTKQKKLHRVPLSDRARQILANMREEAPKDAARLFPDILPRDDGRYDIRKHWKKIFDDAELADFHFHDLRHSYASLLVSSGRSLPIIGRLLGHTQAQTTMRYAHLADDPLREATGVVGEIVPGKGAST